jgi:hypothetical protein
VASRVGYLSGAVVLADARLRLRKLDPGRGLLIVEGGNDARTLSPRWIPAEQILAVGGKPVLTDAFDMVRPQERLAFLRDCDYDVPAGRARLGLANLVLTEHVDLDADVLMSAAFPRILPQVLPYGEHDFDNLAREILDRAVEFASTVGRVRAVASIHDVHLSISIEPELYRRATTALIDERAIVAEVHRRSPRSRMSLEEMRGHVAARTGGPKVCLGADLLSGIQDVLLRDYGASRRVVEALPELLRVALDEGDLERMAVVQRLREWETQLGCQLFRD